MANEYRVFVPVDDNVERSLAQAEFVIDLPCADERIHVTIAHALHDEEREDYRSTADQIESVKRVRERLDDSGVACDVIDLGLPPADGITSQAKEDDSDLIVLGGRKRTPAGKLIFGSVTQKVILNTDRPVTVTGGP